MSFKNGKAETINLWGGLNKFSLKMNKALAPESIWEGWASYKLLLLSLCVFVLVTSKQQLK